MATPSSPIPPAETFPANICAQMVEAAGRACQPAATASETQVNPNWDAMATSFAALSSAFTWGSIILALIAIIVAVGWGRIVTARAEKEARDIAKSVAETYINNWLAKEAPEIIRQRVDLIVDATLGTGNDADAADQIGKEA